jgi:Protein of unknown function (DUF1161)
MKMPVMIIALVVVSPAAIAGKSCEELKTDIAAKIDANHVPSYTLDIVAADQVGERKVVGSCEGGAKKIVYERKTAAPAPASAPADSADKK